VAHGPGASYRSAGIALVFPNDETSCRRNSCYKSTIDLSQSPRQVGEWVFLELANLYAVLDRPCDAVQAIMSWIAIDPATRNTARAHKLPADVPSRRSRIQARFERGARRKVLKAS
jgi:hypothetical protein